MGDNVTNFQSSSMVLLLALLVGIAAASPVFPFRTETDQCGSDACIYCCDSGTPCKCWKHATDPDQCGSTAYTYCCNFGSPCDCSLPCKNTTETTSPAAAPRVSSNKQKAVGRALVVVPTGTYWNTVQNTNVSVDVKSSSKFDLNIALNSSCCACSDEDYSMDGDDINIPGLTDPSNCFYKLVEDAGAKDWSVDYNEGHQTIDFSFTMNIYGSPVQI